jgi:hypothetical protein
LALGRKAFETLQEGLAMRHSRPLSLDPLGGFDEFGDNFGVERKKSLGATEVVENAPSGNFSRPSKKPSVVRRRIGRLNHGDGHGLEDVVGVCEATDAGEHVGVERVPMFE